MRFLFPAIYFWYLDKCRCLGDQNQIAYSKQIVTVIKFQVQWAKMRGCKVIGTCSSDEKSTFLKVSNHVFYLVMLFFNISIYNHTRSYMYIFIYTQTLFQDLGCDRVINYKKEDLFSVLQKEYPVCMQLYLRNFSHLLSLFSQSNISDLSQW